MKARRNIIERTLTSLLNAIERSELADNISQSSGLLQRIDPKIKLICCLLLLVTVGLLHNSIIIICILFIVTTLAILSNISIKTILQTWLPSLIFTGIIALPAFLFAHKSAVLLILRVITCVTISLALVFSTSWDQILKSLRSLRVPSTAIFILEMTHRYIYLLVSNAIDMFEARKSRTIARMSAEENRRLVLSATGTLLVKTMELASDIHLAMISRGYNIEVYKKYCNDEPNNEETNMPKMNTDVAIFQLNNISYSYGDLKAIEDLSLVIKRGQQIALTGANGSGKSTLLKILDGLYFPTSGNILFNGESMNEESFANESFAFDFRRKVGFVFQNPDVQLFNATVYDELAFGPRQLRLPEETLREKIEDIANTMGIAHIISRSTHKLSGGEKKRVALASVLILDPEVLLLDEPTAFLDSESCKFIIQTIIESPDKTIITATHDSELIQLSSEQFQVSSFKFQESKNTKTYTLSPK